MHHQISEISAGEVLMLQVSHTQALARLLWSPCHRCDNSCRRKEIRVQRESESTEERPFNGTREPASRILICSGGSVLCTRISLETTTSEQR